MATPWGSLSGSVIGTGIGAFGGPITAGIGGMIGGGIGGMFDQQGGGGETGWNELISAYPQMRSWDELPPSLKYGSDFVSQQLQNMMEGKPAPYLQEIGALQRKLSSQALSQQYMGGPFTPGNLALQTGYDVQRNLGRGGAASKSYGGQLQKWTEQERAIDDFINQYVMKGSADWGVQMPQLATQIAGEARGWGTPKIFPNQQEAPPDAWGNLLGGIGGALPWLMEGMNFGGSQQPQGQGSAYSNWNDVLAGSNVMKEAQGPGYGGYGYNTGTGVPSISASENAGNSQLRPWVTSGMSSGYNPLRALNQGAIGMGQQAGQSAGKRLYPWLSQAINSALYQ